MEGVEFKLKGYALKQFKMSHDGCLSFSVEHWKDKNIVVILTEE